MARSPLTPPWMTVPLDRWRELFDAADAFYRMRPWEWMGDAQLFAVQDPRSGEMGYCSVMGMLGEHLALGVYLGAQGLYAYREMARQRTPEPEEVFQELRCLMVSFEDREDLSEGDRALIKAVGRRYRGPMAWPQFRSYLPGYMPWYLDANEAEVLLTALQQTLEVAPRVRDNPRLLVSRRRGELFTRVLSDGVWQDTWSRPEPYQPQPVRPEVDPAALAHIAGMQRIRRGTWQLTYGSVGSVIAPPGERPYPTWVCLIAETEHGLIMGIEVLVPAERGVMVPAFLLSTLAQAPVWPAQIQVDRPEAATLIAPVAEALQIPVQQRPHLQAAEAAMANLHQYMNG